MTKPIPVRYGSENGLFINEPSAERLAKVLDYLEEVLIDREDCYQRLVKSMKALEGIEMQLEVLSDTLSTQKARNKALKEVVRELAGEEDRPWIARFIDKSLKFIIGVGIFIAGVRLGVSIRAVV